MRKTTTRVQGAKALILLACALFLAGALSLASPHGQAWAASGSLQGTSMSSGSSSTQGQDVYRLYNPRSGEHLFTLDANERKVLTSKYGWRSEGVAWKVPKSSSTPVFRLYHPRTGEHLYTTDSNEKNVLTRSHGWRYEGVAWYSADQGTARVGVYRLYQPKASNFGHHYTLDAHENGVLVDSHGWNAEGLAWYGIATSDSYKNGWVQEKGTWKYYSNGKAAKGWLVTSNPPAFAKIGGALQRYWIDANGALAINRIINPSSAVDKGAGYMAKATAGGYVARNTSVQQGGTWYYADNDGRLSVDNVIKGDAIASRLAKLAQGYSSPSKYLIMVDIDNPKTVVMEGSKGNWRVKFVWECCTGAPATPTVTGVFHVGIKGYSFGEGHGYSCYYYTQFYGNYLFHTRKYYAYTHTLMDGRIGQRVSAGCVRLYDDAAIWIQKNVPTGTTVVATR